MIDEIVSEGCIWVDLVEHVMVKLCCRCFSVILHVCTWVDLAECVWVKALFCNSNE